MNAEQRAALIAKLEAERGEANVTSMDTRIGVPAQMYWLGVADELFFVIDLLKSDKYK